MGCLVYGPRKSEFAFNIAKLPQDQQERISDIIDGVFFDLFSLLLPQY